MHIFVAPEKQCVQSLSSPSDVQLKAGGGSTAGRKHCWYRTVALVCTLVLLSGSNVCAAVQCKACLPQRLASDLNMLLLVRAAVRFVTGRRVLLAFGLQRLRFKCMSSL